MKRLPNTLARRCRALALLMLSLTAVPLGAAEPSVALFAGGCFWCMESELEGVPGVIDVVSGYTGGHVPNPTYRQVSSGTTGHYEAVRVRYDASRLPYEKLLEYFWSNVDPLDEQGQFCDQGTQYLAAVFVASATERTLALRSREAAARRLREPGLIRTQILDAKAFYPAEAEHQDYYRKNPLRYRLYQQGCGRDQRLEKLWGNDKP